MVQIHDRVAEYYVAKEGESFVVDTPLECNFMLVDRKNMGLLSNGEAFEYADGGYATEMPAKVVAPSAGEWYTVLDLLEPTNGQVPMSKYRSGTGGRGVGVPGHRPTQPPAGY